MRLSTRVAIAVGATVPLLVLATGWLLLRLVAHDLHEQQDAHLRDRAAAVTKDARRLLAAMANDRPAAVEQARERRLYSSALDVGIRLVGPEGTVSGGPQPPAAVPLPKPSPSPVTVRNGTDTWRALSVHVQGARPGVEGELWVFSADTASSTQLGLVRRRVVSTALLAVPLSGLLAWIMAARVSRPLRWLQRRAGGLDPAGGSTRLEHAPTGVTEVDDLAGTLQTVLTRYDEQAARTTEALATARSFSAAAAHELRTPLMSMQTNLEILAGHPGLGPADRDEIVDDLRREHTRLLGLLVMLRELGRGDLVEADAFGPVDLAESVDASVADVRRRHPDAEVTVRAIPGLRVHGWEPGIRTIIDNLLANALVHGRDSRGRARVEVELRSGRRPGGPVAVLAVEDQGPGIPASLRAAVFERFHRGADSPGSGLGLTLVAQQAALHRGSVRVKDGRSGDGGSGDGGTRIEVELPVYSEAGTAVPLPAQRDWLIATAAYPQDFHRNGS